MPKSPARLRVLHVINSMNAGGAEHLLLQQISAGSGVWECGIACIDEAGGLAEAVTAGNIPLFVLGNGRRLNIGLINGLQKTVARFEPDILHLHLPRSGVLGRIAFMWKPGVPIVYTEHNVFEMYAAVTRVFNVASYFRNDATIAVSEAVRRSIVTHVPRRFLRRPPIVLRNGIDAGQLESAAATRAEARKRLGVPENAILVGTIGNLFVRKGQRYLIEAMAELAKRGSDARLVIIGAGSEHDALLALCETLAIRDRVTIATDVANAGRLARAFDVFVLPSIFEGLPISLLEAMALGVPSIGTRVGGIPEVIEDGVHGLLVRPRDVAGLARAIGDVLDDPARRQRLAARGRTQVAANFSIAAVVTGTDEQYRALLRP